MNVKNILVLVFLLFRFACYGLQSEYKVIAYYTGNGETIKQFPIQKLTHIIYSFLKIQNDTLTFYSLQQEQTLQQIVALKNDYPNLKIMVSVGGWGGCAICSELFSSAEHRVNFSKSVVSLFKKYNIDGLDLDWEYPSIEGYPGHIFQTIDKDNFTELVKALRHEMGNRYLLSFAAGGFIKYLKQSVDWNAVLPEVDFVNLMTYDLVGGYSTVTGHHTPLNDYMPDQESTKKCVNWLLNNNAPSSKLIIGAAFYARVWEKVEPTNNGLYQNGIFKQGVAYKDFETYFNDTSGYKYYWDEKANAPFEYNDSKKMFATFDNQHSIEEKTKFIRDLKLGGIMFWELIQDKPTNGLLDEIAKGLN